MLPTASVARSLPFSAAARALSVAFDLKSLISDLTFDLTSPVLPLAGCAFATAFGAEVVVAGFAALVAAGLTVDVFAAAGLAVAFFMGAGFAAAFGFSVSAMGICSYRLSAGTQMGAAMSHICTGGALVNYSTIKLHLKSICLSVVAKPSTQR